MRLGRWEVNDQDFDRYVQHIRLRMELKDHRDIDVKEEERGMLHDRLLDAQSDDDREDFSDALESYVRKIIGDFSYLELLEYGHDQ